MIAPPQMDHSRFCRGTGPPSPAGFVFQMVDSPKGRASRVLVQHDSAPTPRQCQLSASRRFPAFSGASDYQSGAIVIFL
jgi:hypothetical protein